MFFQSKEVQPLRVVNPTESVAHGDDLGPVTRETERGDGAHVAKALNDSSGFGDVEADGVRGAVDEIGNAASGGLAATERAAHPHGFAGDDAGHGVALVHGIRVHHPRHRLFIGCRGRAPSHPLAGR